MLIYLDMCCLKRPFDDQTEPRNRVESEILLALMARESSTCRFVRSAALVLENNQNPLKERAARVAAWLTMPQSVAPAVPSMQPRVKELMTLGFKNFDALHLATAEAVNADLFVTCDDRLLKLAARNVRVLRVRLLSVVDAAKELLS